MIMKQRYELKFCFTCRKTTWYTNKKCDECNIDNEEILDELKSNEQPLWQKK